MMGRADKGIILTTGTFTSDSQKEAAATKNQYCSFLALAQENLEI
jgi:hypothetical protein